VPLVLWQQKHISPTAAMKLLQGYCSRVLMLMQQNVLVGICNILTK
jgi:hypothetical protein